MSKFKLVFFSPATHTRSILDQVFSKYPDTAGRIGKYRHCAFITAGTGQFKPDSDANPTIGRAGGGLELVEEHRVELLINGGPQDVKEFIAELKLAHPYEEAACDVYRLEDF